MEYKIIFLTEKGIEAYNKIKDVKESFRDKMIMKKTFKEEIVSKDPLTIIIFVKVPWLAVQIKLEDSIINQMKEKKCKRDIDYTLEVKI